MPPKYPSRYVLFAQPGRAAKPSARLLDDDYEIIGISLEFD
jgi:hypothetical protein